MKTNTAFILFTVGFLLTLGGVGGVEHSISDADMLGALAISVVGLLIMFAGTLALNVSNYYDQTQTNPTLR